MPLTISQIIPLVASAEFAEANAPYAIGEPYQVPARQLTTVKIYHPSTNYFVAVSWSQEEEAYLPTEAARIAYAKALIKSAMRQLDAIVPGGAIPYRSQIEMPPRQFRLQYEEGEWEPAPQPTVRSIAEERDNNWTRYNYNPVLHREPANDAEDGIQEVDFS